VPLLWLKRLSSTVAVTTIGVPPYSETLAYVEMVQGLSARYRTALGRPHAGT
jgi:hypothetical protein